MAIPQTHDVLVDALRKSGLVDSDRLEKLLEAARDDPEAFPDPKSLAKRLVQDGLISVFQARQLLLGRHRGFVVGNYLVLEALGAGGMSRVFLCKHVRLGHRVAMKVLPDGMADDPEVVRRFYHEATTIAHLNHPNIVRAHDVGQHGDSHYLVMDYVEGCDLQNLVRRRGPLPPAQAASAIIQAAYGLQHIADAGLVHRDIKPGNLIVDTQGVVKILDLGLARSLDSTHAESVGGGKDQQSILGTADYISPEQARKSQDVDIRADIYSLGATFHYLLAGRAPFEDRNMVAKLLAHQMQAAPRLAGVSSELAAIIDRMMAKEVADRFQEPGDVIEALAAHATAPLDAPRPDDLPALSPAAMGPATSGGFSGRGTRSQGPPSTRISVADTATQADGLRRRSPVTTLPLASRTESLPRVSARKGKWRRPALFGLGVLAIAGSVVAGWIWHTRGTKPEDNPSNVAPGPKT